MEFNIKTKFNKGDTVITETGTVAIIDSVNSFVIADNGIKISYRIKYLNDNYVLANEWELFSVITFNEKNNNVLGLCELANDNIRKFNDGECINCGAGRGWDYILRSAKTNDKGETVSVFTCNACGKQHEVTSKPVSIKVV